MGVSVKTIVQATYIDRWFIYEIQKIVDIEKQIAKFRLDTLPMDLLKEAKRNGFSDEQIARILPNATEDEVYAKRKAAGISRVYKMVDTCSAEFEAKTPYFYSTFEDGVNESKVTDKKKVIVLGSGPNRIGQGIEFDYCCVHGLVAINGIHRLRYSR
jgi:carbamoyl-phosphate synthase large subunit